jgi:transcriptional regulator PpsR
MIDEPADKPDITLMLDRDGVITDVSPSVALENEALDRWRGRPWGETVAPALGARVTQAIEASRNGRESQCFRVQQLLPSGRELPFEYTTVSLGKKAGFVAIGRNLQNVSDLQSRLVDAVKAREQDFWRLRDIERRYRAVLDASNEAVALVRGSNMRVVEANVRATRSLGLLPGAEFLPDLSARDRKALEAALELARSQGRAPNIALHLQNGSQWSLRAALITSDSDAFYLLQLAALSGAPEPDDEDYGLEQILHRLPDAFVIVDREGLLLKANPTFLDLAQVGVESAVLGQKLNRWLSQPGEDFAVSPRESRSDPSLSFEFRDTPNSLEPLKDTLEAAVRASVEAIERRYLEEALASSRGNRTLAARNLGLSRQTLHVKLNKYKLDDA